MFELAEHRGDLAQPRAEIRVAQRRVARAFLDPLAHRHRLIGQLVLPFRQRARHGGSFAPAVSFKTDALLAQQTLHARDQVLDLTAALRLVGPLGRRPATGQGSTSPAPDAVPSMAPRADASALAALRNASTAAGISRCASVRNVSRTRRRDFPRARRQSRRHVADGDLPVEQRHRRRRRAGAFAPAACVSVEVRLLEPQRVPAACSSSFAAASAACCCTFPPWSATPSAAAKSSRPARSRCSASRATRQNVTRSSPGLHEPRRAGSSRVPANVFCPFAAGQSCTSSASGFSCVLRYSPTLLNPKSSVAVNRTSSDAAAPARP